MKSHKAENFPPYGWRVVSMQADGGVVLRPSDDGHQAVSAPHRPIPTAPPPPVLDCDRLQRRYEHDLTTERLERLANKTGLASWSLAFLGLGWSHGHWSYTFPMRDNLGQIRGFRLRKPDGSKLAIRGSREGLFIPMPIVKHPDRTILVAEGPSDTAALMQMGYETIGRPSCSGAMKMAADYLDGYPTVIVSDKDSPGRRGAKALCEMLRGRVPSLKVIEPIVGDDAREWLQLGGNEEQLRCVIDTAHEEAKDGSQQIQGFAAG